jgi:MFS family permease
MTAERHQHPWAVVAALGVTQIISWGSIYYVFGPLLSHFERDLGASKSGVVGAFSVALLVSGLLAPVVGRRIDRAGGRWLMAGGSVLGAAGLALLGHVDSLAQLYIAWSLLGLAMAATLYEPAFAVVTQLMATNYRKGITVLTLFGGFASTVFWPLAQALIDAYGWRQAVQVLGLINLLVCVPLHLFLLPGRRPAPAHHDVATAANSKALREVVREPSFYLLCGAFTLNAIVYSAMAVHLLPMLVEKGLTTLQAAAVGAMVGPMQVAGRAMEMVFGRRVKPLHVGMVSLTMLPVSLVVFYFLGPVPAAFFVFALLYGAGNGITTIVRGTIPADLYGRHHYGAVNGAMAAPVLLAKALGPSIAALLWTVVGNYSVLALVLAATAGLGALLLSGLLSFQARTAAMRT